MIGPDGSDPEREAYYESRLARIELPDDERPKIDAEVEALFDEGAEDEAEPFMTPMSPRTMKTRLP